MTPPERLRLELAARRGQGVDFGDAWPASVGCALAAATGAERNGWREAFASTQAAWASAWYRHHALPALRAAGALRELSDRRATGSRVPTSPR